MQALEVRRRRLAVGLVICLAAFGITNAAVSLAMPSTRTDFGGSVRMVNVDVPTPPTTVASAAAR